MTYSARALGVDSEDRKRSNTNGKFSIQRHWLKIHSISQFSSKSRSWPRDQALASRRLPIYLFHCLRPSQNLVNLVYSFSCWDFCGGRISNLKSAISEITLYLIRTLVSRLRYCSGNIHVQSQRRTEIMNWCNELLDGNTFLRFQLKRWAAIGVNAGEHNFLNQVVFRERCNSLSWGTSSWNQWRANGVQNSSANSHSEPAPLVSCKPLTHNSIFLLFRVQSNRFVWTHMRASATHACVYEVRARSNVKTIKTYLSSKGEWGRASERERRDTNQRASLHFVHVSVWLSSHFSWHFDWAQ